MKIVAAFRGMHVSPAEHSYASVTDGQTGGRGQSDPYVSLCFTGDTKMDIRAHSNRLTPSTLEMALFLLFL